MLDLLLWVLVAGALLGLLVSVGLVLLGGLIVVVSYLRR